jgi:hypothetical protein
MAQPSTDVPTAVRRLATEDSRRLARLVGSYDDLQTVLRCCERLLGLLASPGEDISVDALWALAVLCYGRGFVEADGWAPLTEADLEDAAGDGEVLRWHRVLVHLRGQHLDPIANPRESYTVGVAQDESGLVTGVAVTSVQLPPVDQGAVRQAGVLAYNLCAVLDERIAAVQQDILVQARQTPTAELAELELIQVAAAG